MARCLRWQVQKPVILIFSVLLALLHQILNISEWKMFFIAVYSWSELPEISDFALRSSEVRGQQCGVCRVGPLDEHRTIVSLWRTQSGNSQYQRTALPICVLRLVLYHTPAGFSPSLYSSLTFSLLFFLHAKSSLFTPALFNVLLPSLSSVFISST